MKEQTLGDSCREKYWSELDSEQRIGCLRAVMKRLMSQLDDASRTIVRLRAAAECHEHSPNNGQPVLPVFPLRPVNGWRAEDAALRHIEKPDECYI